MKFSKSIHAVDSHTAGEATRIVVGGVPKIPGKSMPEKKHGLRTIWIIFVPLYAGAERT